MYLGIIHLAEVRELNKVGKDNGSVRVVSGKYRKERVPSS